MSNKDEGTTDLAKQNAKLFTFEPKSKTNAKANLAQFVEHVQTNFYDLLTEDLGKGAYKFKLDEFAIRTNRKAQARKNYVRCRFYKIDQVQAEEISGNGKFHFKGSEDEFKQRLQIRHRENFEAMKTLFVYLLKKEDLLATTALTTFAPGLTTICRAIVTELDKTNTHLVDLNGAIISSAWARLTPSSQINHTLTALEKLHSLLTNKGMLAKSFNLPKVDSTSYKISASKKHSSATYKNEKLPSSAEKAALWALLGQILWDSKDFHTNMVLADQMTIPTERYTAESVRIAFGQTILAVGLQNLGSICRSGDFGHFITGSFQTSEDFDENGQPDKRIRFQGHVVKANQFKDVPIDKEAAPIMEAIHDKMTEMSAPSREMALHYEQQGFEAEKSIPEGAIPFIPAQYREFIEDKEWFNKEEVWSLIKPNSHSRFFALSSQWGVNEDEVKTSKELREDKVEIPAGKAAYLSKKGLHEYILHHAHENLPEGFPWLHREWGIKYSDSVMLNQGNAFKLGSKLQPFCFNHLTTARITQIWYGGDKQQIASKPLAEKFGLMQDEEIDGQIVRAPAVMPIHQTRSQHHTAMLMAGMPEHVANLLAGRKNAAHTYDARDVSKEVGRAADGSIKITQQGVQDIVHRDTFTDKAMKANFKAVTLTKENIAIVEDYSPDLTKPGSEEKVQWTTNAVGTVGTRDADGSKGPRNGFRICSSTTGCDKHGMCYDCEELYCYKLGDQSDQAKLNRIYADIKAYEHQLEEHEKYRFEIQIEDNLDEMPPMGPQEEKIQRMVHRLKHLASVFEADTGDSKLLIAFAGTKSPIIRRMADVLINANHSPEHSIEQVQTLLGRDAA